MFFFCVLSFNENSEAGRASGGISDFYNHNVGDLTPCLVEGNVIALRAQLSSFVAAYLRPKLTYALVEKLVNRLEALSYHSASLLIIAGSSLHASTNQS